MTTVSVGGGFRLVSLPRKNWPRSPPFLPHKTNGDHPTQIFKSCLCGGLWQEIFDWERLYSLNWDVSGTVPKTGSIYGVTTISPSNMARLHNMLMTLPIFAVS
jgi:hypothetical protein